MKQTFMHSMPGNDYQKSYQLIMMKGQELQQEGFKLKVQCEVVELLKFRMESQILPVAADSYCVTVSYPPSYNCHRSGKSLRRNWK